MMERVIDASTAIAVMILIGLILPWLFKYWDWVKKQ